MRVLSPALQVDMPIKAIEKRKRELEADKTADFRELRLAAFETGYLACLADIRKIVWNEQESIVP